MIRYWHQGSWWWLSWACLSLKAHHSSGLVPLHVVNRFYSRTFFPFFQGLPLTSLLCFVFCFLNPIFSSSWRKNNSFILVKCILSRGASLVAQMVKNLPAIQETPVWSLCQGRSPGMEMATHPSILAWRIPWIEEPGRLQSVWSQSQTRLND